MSDRTAKSNSAFLTTLILLGFVAGAVVGQCLYSHYEGAVPLGWIQSLEFVGNTFFMSLLKMVLVPLVASSVVVGVSSIGDPSKLGFVGMTTVTYYFSTMLLAVTLGVFLVTTIQPGAGIDEAFRDAQVADFDEGQATANQRVEKAQGTGLWGAVKNITSQLIPSNPIASAAQGQLLPVISFSLILGIVLAVLGAPGQPLLDLFASLFTAMMKLVEWILWLAPVGVFALVAWTVARIGLRSLTGPLSFYVTTVLVGLAIHGCLVLPTILIVFGKASPWHFFMQMRPALLTALGTDSSSATLPVTIECAEGPGGCSRKASQFVLPLGATVNMDGTALYEAVAVVFLFQCFGIDLGAVELGIIVITATLAAVGAAGIPSAGLVTMVIVVEAVNNSLGGSKVLAVSSIGIILGIDRLLDLCRTVVNVWGDAVGAKLITRIAPDEPSS